MFDIYRRLDNDLHLMTPSATQTAKAVPMRQNTSSGENPPQTSRLPQQTNQKASNPQPRHQNQNPHREVTPSNSQSGQHASNCKKSTGSSASYKKRSISGNHLLQGFLPSALYDPNSKKLFGFLKSEDLLLIALIFLLLEKDGDDNLLMILALGYVLLSDYIDLPELGF